MVKHIKSPLENQLKTCVTCKREFPILKKYWHKQPQGRYGFSPYCKECSRKRMRNYKAKLAPDGAMKTCSNCGIEFEATKENFYRHNKGKYRLTSICKKCTKQIQVARHGKYVKQPGVAKRRREYYRNYRLSYKRKESKDANYRAYNIRRARKRNLPHTFIHEDWQRCLEWWNNICAYCGAQSSLWDGILHQEHFIPLSKDGGYTVDNIIPACQHCNTSKGSKDAKDWVQHKFGNRRAVKILARIQEYFDSLE